MVDFDWAIFPTHSNIFSILRDGEYGGDEILCSVVDWTQPVSCESIQHIYAIKGLNGRLGDDNDIFVIVGVREINRTIGKGEMPVILKLTTNNSHEDADEDSPVHHIDDIIKLLIEWLY